MMPLNFASVGDELIIQRIGGKPDVKKHLENLGFVVGSAVKLITALNGNVIVQVKETRVGISRGNGPEDHGLSLFFSREAIVL